MAGGLVFGADAVTPATSLADGQVARRSGGNLIGTAAFHVPPGFPTAAVQSEDFVLNTTGSILTVGSTAINLTAPPDNNTGQNPFQVVQGGAAGGPRLLLKGSNGATPPFLRIGDATHEVDLLLNGNLQIILPGGTSTVNFSNGTTINFDAVNGGKIGLVTDKLSFYGHATTLQQTLSTGVGATVDQVITALQNLGLVKQ